MSEKKTEHITICITKNDFAKLEKLASKDKRKTGQFTSLIVSDYLKKAI